MDVVAEFSAAIGAEHVLTGADAVAFGRDWMGQYPTTPRAVLRPGSTAEVSAVMRIADQHGIRIIPIGGNTGLTGGTSAEGEIMLSLGRMNRIREIRPNVRTALVDAGVILANLHDAAEAHGLIFPLSFGARGSATVGGALSTNAGGSNVLRYGSTRALVLGVEVVLADGRVMNLMSELHKDNSGYALKDLFIGAEGTLGIITGAVVKLFPKPKAYATALVAMETVDQALLLLNRLNEASGGQVEAFEYMPDNYMNGLRARKPELASPFAPDVPVTILTEIGATAPRDATPGPDGETPVTAMLTEVLAELAEAGQILDATVAGSEAQRRKLWSMRESAAEVVAGHKGKVDNDICLPLHLIPEFLERAPKRLAEVSPGFELCIVGHLGDGNLHYTVYPGVTDGSQYEPVRMAIDEIVVDLGGSFSAEHGIGLSKLNSMQRLKDPLALEVMGRIKAALDPKNLLNPGKVLPKL